jgi:NadR type nicotinamide-nucleotide adenylyltransferase
MTRRIAITGPESTGKSLLAESLARHFKTFWVPEFARDYLNNLGRPYEEHDILTIARGQLREEEKLYRQAKEILFCDTEMIVVKIWSEVRYQRCHPWILKTISTHTYDYFLLCDIDLPWEPDPLREHPDRRKFLFDLYFRELTDRKLPFSVITGSGSARMENAISVLVNNLMVK